MTTRRKMPRQKPGESVQDYGTPWDLINAVQSRFGDLHVDLAAASYNAKCTIYITREDDSLSVPWAKKYGRKQSWLNPPFANIAPWAEKCAYEGSLMRVGRIFFLTPASVGSNWYVKHVKPYAYSLALHGRVTFEGEEQAYPKDCMISIFGGGVLPGFDTWTWK
jgi:phage N-6-adenine-methyltransferase